MCGACERFLDAFACAEITAAADSCDSCAEAALGGHQEDGCGECDAGQNHHDEQCCVHFLRDFKLLGVCIFWGVIFK